MTVTLSMVIGFLLLTLATAYFVPVDGSLPELENAKQLHSLDLQLIHLREQLSFFTDHWWYIGPLTLMSLVLLGRIFGNSYLINQVLWLPKACKIVISSIAIATSFSLFATDDILGKAASRAEVKVIRDFKISRQDEYDSIARLIKTRASSELIRQTTPEQSQFIVNVIKHASSLPRLSESAKRELLLEVIEEVQIPEDHNDDQDTSRLSVQLTDAVKLDLLRNPIQLYEKQKNDEKRMENLAKQAEEERSALVETISAPLSQANDLTKEQVSEILGSMFQVPDSLVGVAAAQLLDIVAETSFESVCKPLVDGLVAKIQSKLPPITLDKKESNSISRRVFDVLHELAFERPQRILKNVENNIEKIKNNVEKIKEQIEEDKKEIQNSKPMLINYIGLDQKRMELEKQQIRLWYLNDRLIDAKKLAETYGPCAQESLGGIEHDEKKLSYNDFHKNLTNNILILTDKSKLVSDSSSDAFKAVQEVKQAFKDYEDRINGKREGRL